MIYLTYEVIEKSVLLRGVRRAWRAGSTFAGAIGVMWDCGFGIQGNILVYLGNFKRISSLGAYIWATPHREKNFCGIASKASSWYGWEDPPIEQPSMSECTMKESL